MNRLKGGFRGFMPCNKNILCLLTQRILKIFLWICGTTFYKFLFLVKSLCRWFCFWWIAGTKCETIKLVKVLCTGGAIYQYGDSSTDDNLIKVSADKVKNWLSPDTSTPVPASKYKLRLFVIQQMAISRFLIFIC